MAARNDVVGKKAAEVASGEKDNRAVSLDSHVKTGIVQELKLCYKDISTGKYKLAKVFVGRMEFNEAVRWLYEVAKVLIDYYRVLNTCSKVFGYNDIEFLATSVAVTALSAGVPKDEITLDFCASTRILDLFAVDVISILTAVVAGELEERGKEQLAKSVYEIVNRGDIIDSLSTLRSVISYSLSDLIEVKKKRADANNGR